MGHTAGEHAHPDHAHPASVSAGDEAWLAATWPFVRDELPPPPASVIELGCGPLGGHVPALLRAGYQAVGVDPEAPEATEATEAPEDPPYRRIAFEDYRPAAKADAVIASVSLHHVRDPAAALDHVTDLLVPGGPLGPQKLVGILVDRVDVPAHPSKVVVGVGVNVATRRSSLPPELGPHVAILAEVSDRSPNLPEVERWVVAALERAVERLEAPSGAAAVVAECRRYLYGVGEPVHVDGRSVGILRDLAEDGAASVEHDGARVPVHAGDLTVEEFA